MSPRTRRLPAIIGFFIGVSATAQQPDSSLSNLRKLGLPEAPGSVPVIYVPSVKDRALRLQKSIEAADAWYEKQLNVHVPFVIAVLDAEARGKISDPTAMPYALPGMVVIPAHAGAPPADHPEFLEYEPATFHEAGHLLARALKIASGNPFVNELVAQMFAVAYMAAERPDLKWVLDDLRAGRSNAPILNPPGYTPRYTSLADLDYLYAGVGDANYVWFQQTALGRLAVFLTKDQSFPEVIQKLQKAFPAAEKKSEEKKETLEDISRHLESVRPGFEKAAGSLAGPTTIPRIEPSVCSAPAKGAGHAQIVVRNDTAEILTVNDPKGRDVKIPAHSWFLFVFDANSGSQIQGNDVRVPASLKLPDGTCLTARDEPTLAIFDRH